MSSRHERSHESGLTHFCEHVLLGGTKAIDSSAVKREIELLGGSLNAFTSHDMISIEGDFAEQDFTRALDLVGDLFFHPAFNKAFVDQERKVILQEIAECRDSPWDSVFQGAYDLFYRGKGVGAPILGGVDDLKSFKTQHLKDHWKRVSATRNSIIYVIGNISKAHMDYARERYSHLPRGPGTPTRKTTVYLGKKDVDSQDKDRVYISILFEAPALEDQNGCIRAKVLSAILGEGMNSRIWKRIRDKMGAAYDVKTSVDFFRKNGHLEFRAALDPKKWEKAMDEMIEELRKISQNGPFKSEVDCAINGLMRSTAIMANDHLMVSASDVEALCAGQKQFTFDSRKDLIGQVTQKDVRDTAALIFGNGDPTIQVLGPVDSDLFS
jgi:predicted Zn-dependent peptidase